MNPATAEICLTDPAPGFKVLKSPGLNSGRIAYVNSLTIRLTIKSEEFGRSKRGGANLSALLGLYAMEAKPGKMLKAMSFFLGTKIRGEPATFPAFTPR